MAERTKGLDSRSSQARTQEPMTPSKPIRSSSENSSSKSTPRPARCLTERHREAGRAGALARFRHPKRLERVRHGGLCS